MPRAFQAWTSASTLLAFSGDLLARFEVVIDYARKRLGLRKQEGA